MAEETVKDFLGHPCRTTEAFDFYDWTIEAARKDCSRDIRLVARQVGMDVLKVQARIDRLCALIDAMARHTMSDGDSNELRAMIEVGSEYGHATSSSFSDFAGLTLLALEKGGLWASAKEGLHV